MKEKLNNAREDQLNRATEEARRTELAMLKLLAKKYPSETKRFLDKIFIDKRMVIN